MHSVVGCISSSPPAAVLEIRAAYESPKGSDQCASQSVMDWARICDRDFFESVYNPNNIAWS